MKKLVYIVLFLPFIVLGQTTTENYVKNTTYKVKTTNGTTKVEGGYVANEDKQETVTYFDGLGRAKQSIAVSAGGNKEDIITHIGYDKFGRQAKDYLPYASGSYNQEIRTGNIEYSTQSFYQTKYPDDFAGVSLPDVNAYSQKRFDGSPLNRVLEQAAPGADWKVGNGHTIQFDYQANITNEVLNFGVEFIGGNTAAPKLKIADSYYNAGELYKTITKDENHSGTSKNHTAEEFKNKQGQVVLKRTYADVDFNEDGDTNDYYESQAAHDTYYVYDDYGNLTYVLPPKATNQNITATVLDELYYQYKYDHRNRLVEKIIPGKEKEYIVYDKLDRPVLTQDAILRTTNNWLFTKYDAFGRVAYTGVYYDANAFSRKIHQNAILNSSRNNLYEDLVSSTRNVGGTLVYYTNKGYPNSINNTIYTVNYYDDYIYLPSGFIAPTTVYGKNITTDTKGLATVSKTKVLETPHWITTVSYYDDKARPIYLYAKNDYLNTIDIVESKLDFTGKVLETTTTHTYNKDINNPIVTITIDKFEYDHADRLLIQNQYVNDQIPERIVKNNYDELGQLSKKDVGGSGISQGITDLIGLEKTNIDTGLYRDLNGVDIATDGTITKTAPHGWDNGGFATNTLIKGDGYIEYEPLQTDKHFMVGLSPTNVNASYTSIKYAIYNMGIEYGSSVRVYEYGVNKGDKTTYQLGDIFKVERVGNTIYYKKNGTSFHTSTVASTGNLIGGASLFNPNTAIKNIRFGGGTFTPTTNVITKTAPHGWDNGGFATNTLIKGDGYIEYEPLQTDKHFMVGLSPTNVNASYTTIKYAIYNMGIEYGSSVRVYEYGVWVNRDDMTTTYQLGDIFKVERVGNTIYYKKNEDIFHTSTVASTGSLIGDASLFNPNTAIKNVLVGGSNSSSLQTVDYTYNVRGWLKQINDTDDLGSDVFGFKLNYNTKDISESTALYNGNISETIWKTAYDVPNQTINFKRAYSYKYDALNRITQANYKDKKHNPDYFLSYYGNYNLKSINYDKNGNIKTLIRSGNYYGREIDNLVYTYDSGNKLLKVLDNGSTYNSIKDQGFKDGINTGNDYTYDTNGNMTSDANKQITSILYNHLNLPRQVTIQGKKINYVYDASGIKLSKSVERGSENEMTYYAGNYIYKKEAGIGTPTKLQFFNHPEGYVKNDNGTFNYVYQYKDHLGNVRISYADTNNDGEISGANTTVYENGFEEGTNWPTTSNYIGGSPLTAYDNSVKHSGEKSGRIDSNYPTNWEQYVFSTKVININNAVNTDYIISGWVYLENVSGNQSQLFLMMRNGGNTGYPDYASQTATTTTKGSWIYLEKRVTVPASVRELFFRIDNDKAGKVWFDDLKIYKPNQISDIEIVEESNYYPFGLKHKGYNNVVSSNGNSTAQKFKYNGKEFEESLGLDLYEYGARMFDPATARFTSIDPKSESYYAWSNYHYAANSPILYIDKNGEGWGLLVKAAKAAYKVGKKAYKAHKAGKKFSIKKALKSEALDIVDNISTLADGQLNWDDAIAVVDLATGFGGEAKKGLKALGVATDKAGDIKKKSKYKDITSKDSSVKNIETDVKKSDFEKNLKGEGYEETVKGGGKVNVYTKDGKSYTTRDKSKQGNPTAEYRKDASSKKADIKIRVEKD